MKYLKKIIFIIILLNAVIIYAFEYNNPSNILFEKNNKPKLTGATVPSNFLLYSFDADLIAGWNTKLYDHEKKYIPKKYHNLPILGGWYGNGNQPNKEVLMSNKIDAAFIFNSNNVMEKEIIKYMDSVNIPTITFKGETIEDDIKIYKKLGEILNNTKRSDEIISYIKESIKNTKNITNKIKKKKKVFLALGENGLRTRCVNSILIAGAEYVHKCNAYNEEISFEKLLLYNPDVIIVGKKNAYNHIKNSNKWAKINAVKNNNILFVPEEPFSWVEKKTIMEYFVIQYLATKLYPELSNINLENELIKHLKIFFHYDLSRDEANKLINYEKFYK